MAERTSYEPGTPSWVDLSTSDVDGAKRFYTELFGWDAEDAGPPEETGGYGFFMQGGKRIAGVGPILQPGQPTVWMTHAASADAGARRGQRRRGGPRAEGARRRRAHPRRADGRDGRGPDGHVHAPRRGGARRL